ncbi:MAG: sodium:proton antiporter [Propionibacteriaceae bacterium]|nr:sodium:proton antiporter [Propionibacteriaceae bacterium]
MTQGEQTEQPNRKETPAERSDRNWNELLQELRVTQIGSQILSGFLLTLPFQARFTELGSALFAVFVIAVLSGTLTTLLMVAPVALHRQLFRQHVKKELVDAAHALATAGLVCLALTITLVTGLVIGTALGETAGMLAIAVAGIGFTTVWLILPLGLRARLARSDR